MEEEDWLEDGVDDRASEVLEGKEGLLALLHWA